MTINPDRPDAPPDEAQEKAARIQRQRREIARDVADSVADEIVEFEALQDSGHIRFSCSDHTDWMGISVWTMVCADLSLLSDLNATIRHTIEEWVESHQDELGSEVVVSGETQ